MLTLYKGFTREDSAAQGCEGGERGGGLEAAPRRPLLRRRARQGHRQGQFVTDPRIYKAK